MLLEDEQKKLLAKFVEAHRNAPREARGQFIAVESMGSTQATFIHSRVQGLRFEGSLRDAEVLAQSGFLRASRGSGGSPLFYVLPEGIAFYEKMMMASPAIDTVEKEIQSFLSASEFNESHSAALAKWEQSAALLWAADSVQQLTTIGHLCREALQEFVVSLARRHRVDVSNIEAARTVARLKTVLAARAAKLGTTEAAFLEALISYWGAAADLVQRQEHGSQREREPLVWEDGRRIVFQSCILMYEVSRALK
jgi:hypothetical protein